MVMKINIRIKGLAVCYRQGNYWQVVFICDDWHKVKFTHKKNSQILVNEKELRREGEATRTAIFSFYNVENAPSPSDPSGLFGDDFHEILNLTDERLHGKHPNGKAKIKRKKDPGTELIFLTIPHIALCSFGQTDFPYYARLDTDNSQPFEIGYVSDKVGAEIKLKPGAIQGGSMLFDDGRDNASFPYFEDDVHTLIFDNDCGTSCKPGDNDFRMFYKWLKDNTNEGKRFLAGKFTSLSEEKDRAEFDAAIIEELKSPLQGNCDPVVVEPPPDDPPQGP
ncbi:MAG TPA: hypothetical protein VK892_23115 [Pyrinomonadaceae bacterium]|nr:hypothetical protein [Pyrinomonadaceae bacterium]